MPYSSKIVNQRFINHINSILKSRNQSFFEDELQQCVDMALDNFTNKGFETEESAAEAAIAETIHLPAKNFKITFELEEGKVKIAYGDDKPTEMIIARDFEELMTSIEQIIEDACYKPEDIMVI